jgi:Recombination endonuclease VII
MKVTTSKQANINRQKALKNGDETYIGRTCKRGHSGLRRTVKRNCIECEFIDNKNRDRQEAFRDKLQSRYGLTEQSYHAMVAAQNYRCKICYEPFTQWKFIEGSSRDAYIDHDHDTGKVRGVLCHQCNDAIADFKDNPNHVANAHSYLMQTGNY